MLIIKGGSASGILVRVSIVPEGCQLTETNDRAQMDKEKRLDFKVQESFLRPF